MKTLSNKIRRIICPIDFSTTSLDGLRYAARLAEALNARLTIFYASTTPPQADAQLYEDQNDIAKSIRRQLRIETAQIETEFGVTCDACIESATEGSRLTIGEASAAYDLTVVGTNGSDGLHDHIFRTTTHHRLGLAKCPVLLVPPGSLARVPRKIMYAFDPETNPTYLINDLESLAAPLKAKIRSLYIVPEPVGELLAGSRFPEAMIGVHDRWGFDWELDPICSDEIVPALDKYMKHHKGAVLALSCHNRSVFESLFQENIIEEFSRVATYPVLIFWH
jgi:nucleotide-binding universal stress UspA family protein